MQCIGETSLVGGASKRARKAVLKTETSLPENMEVSTWDQLSLHRYLSSGPADKQPMWFLGKPRILLGHLYRSG